MPDTDSADRNHADGQRNEARSHLTRDGTAEGRRRRHREMSGSRRQRFQSSMERLIELDGALLARVVKVRSRPVTLLLRALCRAHDPDILAMLIAVLVFCGPTASRIANHIGAALISTSLVVVLFKRTVRRARPAGEFQALAPPDRFSFPSGHTAGAFALAISMFGAYPSLAPALVLVAIIVGWARMYLGVHYPIDVLAGVCIGVFTGSVVALW